MKRKHLIPFLMAVGFFLLPCMAMSDENRAAVPGGREVRLAAGGLEQVPAEFKTIELLLPDNVLLGSGRSGSRFLYYYPFSISEVFGKASDPQKVALLPGPISIEYQDSVFRMVVRNGPSIYYRSDEDYQKAMEAVRVMLQVFYPTSYQEIYARFMEARQNPPEPLPGGLVNFVLEGAFDGRQTKCSDEVIVIGVRDEVPEAAVSVLVNGRPIACDVPPLLENGRTLVPLRALGEALGAEIGWDGSTETATLALAGTTVELKIGSREALVNGRQLTLDVPARLIGGRTFVPLRFIGQALGARVEWDEASRTASVKIDQIPTQ